MMIDVELRENEIIETDFQQREDCDTNMEIGTIVEGIVPDYTPLANKPQINGNTLVGDMSTADLGIQLVGIYENENLNIRLS